MIEGLAKLAEWAAASNSVVAWLLALNLGTLLVLTFWLVRYQPRILRLMRTLQAEQRAQGEAIIAALHASTKVMQSLAELLNISATGQASRPIILTLDGVGPKVDELIIGMRTLMKEADSALEKLERIERRIVASKANLDEV